jgi:hypothetical protein
MQIRVGDKCNRDNRPRAVNGHDYYSGHLITELGAEIEWLVSLAM